MKGAMAEFKNVDNDINQMRRLVSKEISSNFNFFYLIATPFKQPIRLAPF